MRMKSSVLLMSTLLVAAVSSADAATKKRTSVYDSGSARQATVVRITDDDGRRRTKILVQRRSYLDAGTMVLPGQRKYHDYADPPFRDPFDMFGPGKGAFDRNPIGPRWEFGGARY